MGFPIRAMTGAPIHHRSASFALIPQRLAIASRIHFFAQIARADMPAGFSLVEKQ